MKNKLTLLVFLKDRFDFTKRLCQFLHQSKYPFSVCFADGSLEDKNESFFKELKNQNFNYTYKRFAKDVTLNDFYNKCLNTIQNINTTYVMLADNDDFPIYEGQNEAIEFLEKNKDYSACNGFVSGVEIFPDSKKSHGRNAIFYRYYCSVMDLHVSLEQPSSIDRISYYNKNFTSVYYSVIRTSILRDIFENIKNLKFSDLGVFELFFSYMLLMSGKVKFINSVTYIRQKGSSQTAANQPVWFLRLFYTNWLEDLKNAIHFVSNKIAEKEILEKEMVFDSLYEKFTRRFEKKYTCPVPKTVTCVSERLYVKLLRFLIKIRVPQKLITLLSSLYFFDPLKLKVNFRRIEKIIFFNKEENE